MGLFSVDRGWQTLAEQVDAVCFGSLAQRSRQSRETVRSFLQGMRASTTRILDVNLRQTFYSAQTLSESAQLADIIKLNHDELPVVVKLLGFPFHDEDFRGAVAPASYGSKLVCVTRGAKGSLLVGEYATDEHPGCTVEVVDTVGCGRCFHGGACLSLPSRRFSLDDE